MLQVRLEVLIGDTAKTCEVQTSRWFEGFRAFLGVLQTNPELFRDVRLR